MTQIDRIEKSILKSHGNNMLNKAILIGNLGADPETKYTQGGTTVATFSLATTEKWKGKNGDWQEDTTWHRCVVWGNLAEICGKYLQKGSKVYLDGKIKNRKYQTNDGSDRYVTEIIASEIKFMSGTRQQENSGSERYDHPPMGGTGEDVPF